MFSYSSKINNKCIFSIDAKKYIILLLKRWLSDGAIRSLLVLGINFRHLSPYPSFQVQRDYQNQISPASPAPCLVVRYNIDGGKVQAWS